MSTALSSFCLILVFLELYNATFHHPVFSMMGFQPEHASQSNSAVFFEGEEDNPIKYCKEHWFEQTIDHFNPEVPPLGKTTFMQRYYVCDKHWKDTKSGNKGPVLFYVGNESEVELYIKNSGLMWEMAPKVGGLLLFAEHRFYGKSLPFGNTKLDKSHLPYLSSDQAMEDFAQLLTDFKIKMKIEKAPIIGFGGSYGGMLASWMRMKYPHILAGAVACSAPLAGLYGQNSNTNGYYEVVTRDATPYAGSAPRCRDNVQRAFNTIINMAVTSKGNALVRSTLKLCGESPVPSKLKRDMNAIRNWALVTTQWYSMGMYPFKSGYMFLGGKGELPAWPMRVACDFMAPEFKSEWDNLAAFANFQALYHNASGTVQCFNISYESPKAEEVLSLWGWQACTELFLPIGMNGKTDMFWSDPFEITGMEAYCNYAYDLTPERFRPSWGYTQFAGARLNYYSNIVFSNGELDPWFYAGIVHNMTDTIRSVSYYGGHHLDLMWSHPNDTASVIEARRQEVAYVNQWVEQHYSAMSK